LNPTYSVIENPHEDDNSIKKNFFSENELKHAKDYINDKISNEEKLLKNRISGYLDKVKIIKTTNVKDNLIHDYKIQKKNREINRNFYNYAKNVVLNDNNIKMINYKKLKPLPIKDKSCPNLQNIKHKLFPHIREGKIKNDNYVNINNCNSIKNINGLKLYKKIELESKSNSQDNNIKNNINYTFNDSEISSEDKKNSFNTLKRLINRNRSLLDGSNRKYEKLSTLIDIQLPKISEYESIIQKKHNQNEENLKEIKNNKDDIEIKKSSGIKNIIDKEEAVISNCSNYELLNQLRALKDQLQSLKEKKLDVDENYLKNKKEFINYLFNIKENPYLNNNKYLGNKERNIIKKIFNENPATRLPSSHSVTLLKRRFSINSGLKNEINKINRNYSNHTRDKTCPTTLKNSVKNSSSSVFDTSKSEKEYKQIFNKINAEQKKEEKNRIIISPLIPISQDKSLVFSKNNYNSSNITSFSDF
jgi:polyhydroxyalkanoate synthesis regulator phasin